MPQLEINEVVLVHCNIVGINMKQNQHDSRVLCTFVPNKSNGQLLNIPLTIHYLKSARIRSYSDPNFPAFGQNTKRYEVSLRIQPEYGEMRTRITPNTDTFTQ